MIRERMVKYFVGWGKERIEERKTQYLLEGCCVFLIEQSY